MATEIQRRFGDVVGVSYLDVSDPDSARDRSTTVKEFRERGLVYPVTVIDGVALYDGAVSYPAILRAVSQRLDAAQTAEA